MATPAGRSVKRRVRGAFAREPVDRGSGDFRSRSREMIENALTFTGSWAATTGRSEGIVLRYLTDAYQRAASDCAGRADDGRAAFDYCLLSALIRAVGLPRCWTSGRPCPRARPFPRVRGRRHTEGAESAFGAREDGTVPFSANRHAFRTVIRGALFERVEAMSQTTSRPWRAWTSSRTPVVAPWASNYGTRCSNATGRNTRIGIDQRARPVTVLLE